MSLEKLRKKIQQHLRESTGAPLYVEYLRDRPGETPFELGGKKWQFVNAKYPDGKQDIGVYAFGEDLVYHYESWRKMMNIDKENPGMGASNYDRHMRSDMKSKNETTEVGSREDVYLSNKISYRPYENIISAVREDFGKDSDIYLDLMDFYAYNQKFELKDLVAILQKYDVADRYDVELGINENELDFEDNENDYDSSLDFTDNVEQEDSPDYENDAFIQDVVSGGYDVGISGKHLGHYDDMGVALDNLENEFNRSNYFPTIWFVSDHGNTYPINLQGQQIKTGLNEISPNLFKSAINVSKERGTDRRTAKLGSLYFNKFIGTPLMGGKISNIEVHSPGQGNYSQVQIEIEHTFDKAPVVPDSLKHDYITYDIYKDIFDLNSNEIERKDAFILSKIALQINPNSKYKETGKYFQIKGMNENRSLSIKKIFENTLNADTAKEIEDEIEMMMRPNDDGLDFEDQNTIANNWGLDFEDVSNYVQSYLIKRQQERNTELTYWVKELLSQFNNYDKSGMDIPTWDEFFNKWTKEGFQEENSWATSDNVKKEFLKQTVNQNQLSLFENNIDKSEKCYIEYLNASKKFTKTKKVFNTYAEAITWGRKNISNFNLDMIRYEKLFENKLPSIKEIVMSRLNENSIEWSDDKWKNQMGINDDNLMPDKLITTFYERIFDLLRQGQNIQDESVQQELNRLIKLNGKIPKEIQDLLDDSDKYNNQSFDVRNENDFDFDEGPQPGDAGYHNPDSSRQQIGIGNFENVDWQIFHETLIANEEAMANGGRLADNPNFYPSNFSNLTDNDEGLMTIEELQKLIDFDIVDSVNSKYVILNPEYKDYNVFLNKAKEIWNKNPHIDHSPSTFRYRDAGGTDGG